MRIQLITTANEETVPFDYQQKLIGVVHHWLGDNELHDGISLYSFSWLHNGMLGKNGYEFKNGAKWLISFYEDQYTKKLIAAILRNPSVICGMIVRDITIEEEMEPRDGNVFMLGSPIFIKRSMSEGNSKYYTFEDSESSELMKETLLHKMEVAGLEKDETLEIRFDLTYPKKKVKMATIHRTKNKCSMCPVIITGKPETIRFALNVGIGNLTGSGFGSIY